MRLRFTIRDLLLITIIAGMAISWWFDHRKLDTDFRLVLDRGTRLAKERDEMEAQLNKMRDSVKELYNKAYFSK
jgi:hypothetical protein